MFDVIIGPQRGSRARDIGRAHRGPIGRIRSRIVLGIFLLRNLCYAQSVFVVCVFNVFVGPTDLYEEES